MFLKKYWIWLFLPVLLADAVSLAVGYGRAHFVLKLLLMPILFMGLSGGKQYTADKNWRLILAGLIIAWAGDALLLFSDDMPVFFVMGLICFLFTHLLYIAYFFRYNKGRGRWFLNHPVTSFAVVTYAVCFFALVQPSLGPLMIPVAIYTLVISVMLLQALSAQPFISGACNRYFVIGAVLFVLSDSLLAWNRFVTHFFLADAAIMISYGFAQLLMVLGAKRNTDKVLTQ